MNALKLHLPPDESAVSGQTSTSSVESQSAVEADTADRRPATADQEWLWCEECERRSGKNAGTWRRNAPKLEKLGLARKAVTDAGREAWQISSLADPKLKRVKFADDNANAIDWHRDVPAELRDELREKIRYVQEAMAAMDRATADGRDRNQALKWFCERFVSPLGRKSPATARGWIAKYKSPEGALSLIDRRKVKSDDAAAADAERRFDRFWDHFLKLYLHDNGREQRRCYDSTVDHVQIHKLDWAIPSIRTINLRVEALDPKMVARHREGPKAYTDNYAVHQLRDYSTIDSNDLWCGDDHIFDVLVNIGTKEQPKHIRPWITAWEDVRSRKIVGYSICINAPTTLNILRAFHNAAHPTGGDHGLPRYVYVDNGKVYDNAVTQGETKKQRQKREREARGTDRKRYEFAKLGGAFGMLGVGVMHTWKEHGQSKPVERAFGTICRRFSKLWDTYCGRNPQEKPAGLKDRLARGMAPTFAEFCDTFAAWLESDYHFRLHTGHAMGTTPQAAWVANLQSKRVAAPHELTLACMPSRLMSVRQTGLHIGPVVYGHSNPELVRRIGQQVRVYQDPLDATRVFCTTPDSDLLICTAELYDRVGWVKPGTPIEALSAMLASQKATNKAVRDEHRRKPAIAVDPLADIAAKAEQLRQQQTGERPDASVSIVQTPFGADSTRFREALEAPMRKAAGAESMSFSPDDSTDDLLDELLNQDVDLSGSAGDDELDPLAGGDAFDPEDE